MPPIVSEMGFLIFEYQKYCGEVSSCFIFTCVSVESKSGRREVGKNCIYSSSREELGISHSILSVIE